MTPEEKAVEWLGRFEEAGLPADVVVYSSVIDACGKVGDPERATAIFQRMEANDPRACGAMDLCGP